MMVRKSSDALNSSQNRNKPRFANENIPRNIVSNSQNLEQSISMRSNNKSSKFQSVLKQQEMVFKKSPKKHGGYMHVNPNRNSWIYDNSADLTLQLLEEERRINAKNKASQLNSLNNKKPFKNKTSSRNNKTMSGNSTTNYYANPSESYNTNYYNMNNATQNLRTDTNLEAFKMNKLSNNKSNGKKQEKIKRNESLDLKDLNWYKNSHEIMTKQKEYDLNYLEREKFNSSMHFQQNNGTFGNNQTIPINPKEVDKYQKELSRRPFLLKVPKMVQPVKSRPPTSQTNAMLKRKEQSKINSKRGAVERDSSPTYSKDRESLNKRSREMSKMKELVLKTNSSDTINIIHQNKNSSDKTIDILKDLKKRDILGYSKQNSLNNSNYHKKKSKRKPQNKNLFHKDKGPEFLENLYCDKDSSKQPKSIQKVCLYNNDKNFEKENIVSSLIEKSQLKLEQLHKRNRSSVSHRPDSKRSKSRVERISKDKKRRKSQHEDMPSQAKSKRNSKDYQNSSIKKSGKSHSHTEKLNLNKQYSNIANSNLKFSFNSKGGALEIGEYQPKKPNFDKKIPKNPNNSSSKKDNTVTEMKSKKKASDSQLKSKVLFDSSHQILQYERGSSIIEDFSKVSSTKKLKDIMDSIVWLNEESDDELQTPPEFLINQLMTEKFSLEQIKVMSKIELQRNWADIEFILNFKYTFIHHLTTFEQILLLGKTVIISNLCFDKPQMLQGILVTYFRTAEAFYSNMTLDYNQFIYDMFEIIDFLVVKLDGIEHALIYGFAMIFKNCSNNLYLFPEQSILTLVVKYFKFINNYMSQCISYFEGNNDKLVLEKFSSFDIHKVLDIIFRFAANTQYFLKDTIFCNELHLQQKNFVAFCINHNEFSRGNDNIMMTLLECFSCNFILLKHKNIFKFFVRKFKGIQFYHDYITTFIGFANSLKKSTLSIKGALYFLKSSLLSFSKNLEYDNVFQKKYHIKIDKNQAKSFIFFVNRYLLDKSFGSNMVQECYKIIIIFFECQFNYLNQTLYSKRRETYTNEELSQLSDIQSTLKVGFKETMKEINNEKRIASNSNEMNQIKSRISEVVNICSMDLN